MNDYHYVGKELATFATARIWKQYVRSQIEFALTGRVLEVGAGIGANLRAFRSERQASWTCLEPDASLAAAAAREASTLPLGAEIVCGTLNDLPAADRYDAILYLDVLEHIEDDRAELARAAARLAPGGRLIVLAPAHPWLYTPFDREIGHWRRYTRKTLAAVGPPDLMLERLVYLDSMGLLASLGNRLLLRSAMPTAAQVAIWDRCLVRASRVVDPLTGRRVGKSVLAIWRA